MSKDTVRKLILCSTSFVLVSLCQISILDIHQNCPVESFPYQLTVYYSLHVLKTAEYSDVVFLNSCFDFLKYSGMSRTGHPHERPCPLPFFQILGGNVSVSICVTFFLLYDCYYIILCRSRLYGMEHNA